MEAGYEEMQFNLPRDEWLAIARTQVYDNTWVQTPTQGWMFAALEQYHGGGAAAAIEPFSKHKETWEWTLATFIGAGVGTCYRGTQLYDTPEIESMVRKWTTFWVKHRRVLTEDVIHVRRPTVSDYDCLCHVTSILQHPHDAEAMLCMLYNPTKNVVQDRLRVSAYYTGLKEGAKIVLTEKDDASTSETITLGRESVFNLKVNLKAKGISWFTVIKTV